MEKAKEERKKSSAHALSSLKESRKGSSVKGTADNLGYKGPIKIPVGPSGTKAIRVNMSHGFAAATNGSGVWTYQFAADDITSVSGWADFQDTWGEFRILGLEVILTPIAASSSTPIAIILVGEHVATPTTLTTVDQALAYDNAVTYSSNMIKKMRYAIRASSVEEMEFQDTSANVNAMVISAFSSTGTNSVNYFFVQETFLVEFRNPRDRKSVV